MPSSSTTASRWNNSPTRSRSCGACGAPLPERGQNASPNRCGTIGPTPPEDVRLVLYEYPFNESIRTMLRLEHLFDRLGQLIPRDTAVDHHYALATIFEIVDVASRADLK